MGPSKTARGAINWRDFATASSCAILVPRWTIRQKAVEAISVTPNEILRQFSENQAIYSGMADSIRHLLTVLMKSKDIVPHSVSSRVKTTDSLSEKIRRPDKEYESLEDITDLV